MGIKIKNKDPKTYDFAKEDIVINHKEGTLFFKSDKGLHKVQNVDTITVSTDEASEGGGSDAYYSSSLQILESITGSALEITGDRVMKFGAGSKPGDGSNPTAGRGSISTKGGSGGWAHYFRFLGSGDTDHGGFYGFGNSDAITRYGVSPAYNSKYGLHIVSGSGTYKVGIGTIYPSKELTVTGEISASSTITANAFSGDGANITGVISASYAVSSSHEIITEISSSYAVTASHALNSGGAPLSASHASSASNFVVNGFISASGYGSATSRNQFGHTEIGTTGSLGQFPGSYNFGTNGAVLRVNGDVIVSGSIVPFVTTWTANGSGMNLGSSFRPWDSLHVINNSIHFYSTDKEASDDNRKLLGKLQFEEGKGLKITDESDAITNLSGSNVIATEGMKSPVFSGVTGSIQRIENVQTASIGRIISATINGGSF